MNYLFGKVVKMEENKNGLYFFLLGLLVCKMLKS